MKRTTYLMILLLMLLPGLLLPAYAESSVGYAVSVTPETCVVGEEFTVLVSLDNYTENVSGILDIQVDITGIEESVLEVVSCSSVLQDTGTANISVKYSETNKRVRLVCFNIDSVPLSTANRDVLAVVLKVKDTVTEDGSVNLPLTVRLTNADRDNITLTGQIPVTYSLTSEPMVATIGNAQYATVAEALIEAKSGDTIRLIADAVEAGNLTLPVGVTLDLGAYSLTADSVIGVNGSFLTATPNTGKLIVDKNSVILGQEGYQNEKGQYVLPIWDPNQNCYLFSLFVVNTDATKGRGLFLNEEAGEIKFQFKHQATGALNQGLLCDGASDNAMKVLVRLEWETDNGVVSQDFFYNDAQIGLATGSYDYIFTLTGYSALNMKPETLKVMALVETVSGATAFGSEWSQENAQ